VKHFSFDWLAVIVLGITLYSFIGWTFGMDKRQNTFVRRQLRVPHETPPACSTITRRREFERPDLSVGGHVDFHPIDHAGILGTPSLVCISGRAPLGNLRRVVYPNAKQDHQSQDHEDSDILAESA